VKGLTSVIHVLLKEKKDIILSIVYGVIGGLTAVALFSSSGYLISKAALVPPIYALMILVSIVKLLGLISAASRYGERLYSHRGTFTMLSNLRVSFYEKLEPLAPSLFNRYRSGDLLARIVGDVEALQNFFLRVFYPPIVVMLVFFVTIFFTAFFSLEAAIILLIGLLLTTIIVPAFIGLKLRRAHRNVRESRAKLSTDVTELLVGFRDLKIYQQVANKEKEVLTSANEYLEEQEKKSAHQLFGESASTFISLIITVAVLAVCSYLVVVGDLNGLFLAMLTMISLTVFENTTAMAAFPSHLQDSRQAAARLHAVIDNAKKEESIQVQPNEASIQLYGAPFIRVEGVHFTYPDDNRDMLKNVSFDLPKGSKTAIVGPSGSGKSTVMQLLLKMYPVRDGRISINTQPIEQISQGSIWENTNVVLQKNHFFYGTLRENLELAKNDLKDEEMMEVLRKVELSHLSLDEQVLEKGENLSGGEKQRLAIARAILKGAHFWLLDEPSSSLDALTEATVTSYLFEQAASDTVVLISHRLTGLEKMDQIIVMDQGEIIETGTYNELIANKGYFYQLKKIEQNVFIGN